MKREMEKSHVLVVERIWTDKKKSLISIYAKNISITDMITSGILVMRNSLK